MTADLLRAAHAVLFPATDAAELTDDLLGFLAAGGRTLLLGESREEYVARRMGEARVAAESPDAIRALTARVAQTAGRPVLIGRDVELGGIERTRHLAPPLPTREEATALDGDTLVRRCAETASGVRDLGVNLALAPIVDVLDAPNPWLGGRHWGPDAATVERLATHYVAAFEAAGVATTVKHFPGHRGLTTDPAVEDVALVPGDRAAAERDLEPFRAAFAAGASCVMTGPGTVVAFDDERPALLSPAVIGLLRGELRFAGLVISDDLDAAAVVAGRTLEQAAVEALAAGNDLLLVSAANDLPALAAALVAATDRGDLPAARLTDAAARIDALAASRT